MTNIYETFSELAGALVDGEALVGARTVGFVSWQRGITDFAAWLDHIGVKVSVSDAAKDFYSFQAKRRNRKLTT